jgi:hypothetical protein
MLHLNTALGLGLIPKYSKYVLYAIKKKPFKIKVDTFPGKKLQKR